MEWELEYNDFKQLTKRYDGTTWTNGSERFEYAYDDNGNLISATNETKSGAVWSASEVWNYEWNPRDQMTRGILYKNGSSNNSGSVSYQYCLSCDGALSMRLEYGAGTGSATSDGVGRTL